jgi:hypothetical protein
MLCESFVNQALPETFKGDAVNEEPAGKLTQKVALTHSSVKNNECDVTYVLKEPRRRTKCVIHKA